MCIGRNLSACRQVFDELRPQYAFSQGYGTPGSSHKRRSIGDGSDTSLDPSRKRLQTGSDLSSRPLQPKPTPANPHHPSTPPVSTTVPRRRGRPTNAQVQARTHEAMQRGEMLPASVTTSTLTPQTYGEVPGSGSFALGGLPRSTAGSFAASPPASDAEKTKKKRGRPQGSTTKPKVVVRVLHK